MALVDVPFEPVAGLARAALLGAERLQRLAQLRLCQSQESVTEGFNGRTRMPPRRSWPAPLLPELTRPRYVNKSSTYSEIEMIAK